LAWSSPLYKISYACFWILQTLCLNLSLLVISHCSWYVVV
jgi:hypothetical protein